MSAMSSSGMSGSSMSGSSMSSSGMSSSGMSGSSLSGISRSKSRGGTAGGAPTMVMSGAPQVAGIMQSQMSTTQQYTDTWLTCLCIIVGLLVLLLTAFLISYILIKELKGTPTKTTI